VSQRFVRDAIQLTAAVLNDWRAVWRAFVIAGLPLRSEANEILQALRPSEGQSRHRGDQPLQGSESGDI